MLSVGDDVNRYVERFPSQRITPTRHWCCIHSPLDIGGVLHFSFLVAEPPFPSTLFIFPRISEL
jgi:hypothetical protein